VTHLSETAWLNIYGSCAACGSPVSHYAVSRLLLTRIPAAEGFDYWVACDNDSCMRHEGEGMVKGGARPAWNIR